MNLVSVDASNLERVLDILRLAYRHHKHRDESDAYLQLSEYNPSPLTTQLATAYEIIKEILRRENAL